MGLVKQAQLEEQDRRRQKRRKAHRARAPRYVYSRCVNKDCSEFMKQRSFPTFMRDKDDMEQYCDVCHAKTETSSQSFAFFDKVRSSAKGVTNVGTT